VETGSLADLRHLRRTRVRAELLGSMDGIASVPGLHDVAVADGVLTCTADPTRSTTCSASWPASACWA
jgi:ABC-2 type transport system ATP-binding protein